MTDAAGTTDGSSLSPDALYTDPVAFMYKPAWTGVQSVDVIGGFGMGSGVDWVTPIATLTEGSDGSFTGSAMVPAGTYPFLFHVVGDNAAGSGSATYSRYALDETVAEFEQCPDGPTAGNDPNPCSLVTVPQDNPETMYAVKGTVTLGGSDAAKYLVVLERDEPSSHHFFVNRLGTGANGTYTFRVAAGTYRVQVQWAGYESTKDSAVNPAKQDTVRRTISSAFAVAATTQVSNADVMPPDYSTFGPSGSASPLPTTFTFPAVAATHLDVYGPGAEIGDPWYAGSATATGSAAFDGTFNTAQAGSDTVDKSDTYSWGIEWAQTDIVTGSGGGSGSDNGAKWTAQSLVYPVSWPND
ncbi:MAG TPA: carboxypeptidase-like regulatory domain-containing protein [Kofleriaceae bacterium]